MTRICSDKHFSRLLKSFQKKAYNQIYDNKDIRNHKNLFDLIVCYFSNVDKRKYTVYSYDLKLLEYKFKSNPFKTHSCIDDTIMHPLVNKFWVSYTVEDTNHKRCKKNDSFIDKKLVFRLYLKIGNYRKKRIARWIVPMEWHNNKLKNI